MVELSSGAGGDNRVPELYEHLERVIAAKVAPIRSPRIDSLTVQLGEFSPAAP
jgi:hypothetical protein